jgi:hypothetical protein
MGVNPQITGETDCDVEEDANDEQGFPKAVVTDVEPPPLRHVSRAWRESV